MHIHSSWNPDRVAACCLNKPSRNVSVRKPEQVYCEYRKGSLKVKTHRGAVRFCVGYDSDIVSAHTTANGLEVELANGAHYSYRKVEKGYELLSRGIPQVKCNMMSGTLQAA